jgi:rhamnosyltransferase
MSLKTGLCVPTLNAGSDWERWLHAYSSQTVLPDFSLVIDSSSSDHTVELAKEAGFTIHQIDKSGFNHGATRQLAVNMMADADVAIFLTQDAILSSSDSLERILQPFDDASVAAVCGRQLPRIKSAPIEAHARIYNYSPESHVREIGDINKYGLKTAFISNSFSAYRISALNQVGGFPENVIFGEDMYVATKLLLAGYKIAYSADACVYHSHDYSLTEEMKRYFDMGVFHAREPWIKQELGGAEREGLKFVHSEIKFLYRHAFWRIPEALLRTVFRYVGFRLGLAECRMSLNIKRKLSMNSIFFKEIE